MSAETRERYSEVLHKTHGWLELPEGFYFALNDTGKMVYVYTEVEGHEDGTYFWPYGTEFRTTSILAWAGRL